MNTILHLLFCSEWSENKAKITEYEAQCIYTLEFTKLFSFKYYYLFELGYEMLLEKLIQFSNENVINITQQFKHKKKT